MLNFKKVIAALGLLALVGCQSTLSNNSTAILDDQAITTQAPLPYRGRIEFIELEGGFYGIITTQGEKLLPLNLKPPYLQHGTKIEFSGHRNDIMTVVQWGQPFTLAELRLIK
jgi:hypothetical protein